MLKKKATTLTEKELVKLLSTNSKALAAFEDKYKTEVLTKTSDNFFEINAKQASQMHKGIEVESIDNPEQLEIIINQIVEELLYITPVWRYNGKTVTTRNGIEKEPEQYVSLKDINSLPAHLQPQLTGMLMMTDIAGEESYKMVLQTYKQYLKEKNPKEKQSLYGMFRQGLDILDLDAVIYEMLGINPNSIGHWLPQITEAVRHQEFFKIPKTTIITVPITLLQLTRLCYEQLTKTTLEIVDRYCQKVFELDESKEYFILSTVNVLSAQYDTVENCLNRVIVEYETEDHKVEKLEIIPLMSEVRTDIDKITLDLNTNTIIIPHQILQTVNIF